MLLRRNGHVIFTVTNYEATAEKDIELNEVKFSGGEPNLPTGHPGRYSNWELNHISIMRKILAIGIRGG